MNILAIIFVSILLSQSYESEAQSEPLVVEYIVFKGQSRPLQIEENGENHSGIITDYVKLIFKNSPYRVNYRTLPVKRAYSHFKHKQIKNWVTYGSPPWAPEQGKNLTAQLFTLKNAFLVHNSDFKPVSKIEELFGKKLMLFLGFQYPEVDQHLQAKKIREFRVRSFKKAFHYMRNRRADAFLDTDIRLKYNLKSLGYSSREFKIVTMSHILKDFPIHLALDPEMNPALQKFIHKRILELESQKTISKIIKKYTE